MNTSGERLLMGIVCTEVAHQCFASVFASRSSSSMSQARVTDFYSRKKKGTGGPAKVLPQRSSTAGGRGSSPCSSSVHEEFVRVIDEAAGLNNGESAISSAAEHLPSSPPTPKRTSTDVECALGATAEHSTAKKSRPAEAAGEALLPHKSTRKTAKKKLDLPAETPQVLGKEDIAALRSRLVRIRKRVAETPDTASSGSATPSSSSSSHSVPNSGTPSVPETSTNAKALKFTVARAKELAAKAQRRKEEREAEESKQPETAAQDSTEHPAYQRYHTLAQAAPPGLSLPYHYKVLAEMFRSMDTVIAMLYNRCETATFAKIKRGVQDMMHKRFEESHIGQIKTVFPEAYTFRQEKNIPTFNSSIKKGSYQLTVEPIIPSELNEARPLLSASHLLERRRIFHQNLVSMAKQHHKVFLASLDPPVLVPEDRLTRWHPRFNVDTVAPVHTSSLPQIPQTDKLATAQEVLDKARSLITPKMEKALVGLALKTEDKAADKEETSVKNPAVPQTSAVPAAQVPNALKGVSQSLLDRIRAKEAQRLQAAMTRNSNQEERLLMMSRLGELARILRNVFVAEKKPSLIMEVACNRMVASYRSSLSTGEMEKHIRLLADVTGDWLTIHPVRKDLYLKLNKSVELSSVVDKLNSRLREEERL